MNADTTRWDLVLAEALTRPGAADPDGELSRDGDAFVWGRWNAPTWSAEQAFARLGIRRLVMSPVEAQHFAGYATAEGIALNPRTRQKVRTAAHELAHVELRHLHHSAVDRSRMPVEEFEADCVALLVCVALDLGESAQADCRYYIQRFVTLPCGGPLPRTWDHLKVAASRILAAGAGAFVVSPEPPPLKVVAPAKFAARIQWHS